MNSLQIKMAYAYLISLVERLTFEKTLLHLKYVWQIQPTPVKSCFNLDWEKNFLMRKSAWKWVRINNLQKIN